METCTVINAEGFGFQTIFSAIDEMSSKPTIMKQSYSSIAQVVASICAKTSEANRNAAVSKYISELKVKENLKVTTHTQIILNTEPINFVLLT